MDKEQLQSIASQLRQPSGEMGLEIASRMNTSNAFMNRFAIENLELKDGNTLLEVGHGNAYFAHELLKTYPALNYHGIDYSPLMTQEAEMLCQNFVNEGRAQFHSTEVNSIPLPHESCDCVLGVNVVYFWDNPTMELKELEKVLKKDGRIVFGMRSFETMKKLPVTNYNFNLYNQEDLSGFAKQAGLNLTEVVCTSEVIKGIDGQELDTETWAVIIEK